MNKIYLFTAAFAVMASLPGCSDTELASIDTAQEKTPIGFHTVGSQMGSRATAINSGNLTSYSFNVYAFTRNDNGTDKDLFMGTDDTDDAQYSGDGGVNISYKDNKWGYTTDSELKYWPTDALNFYAVSPVSNSESVPNYYTWQITQDKKEIHYLSGDEYGEGSHPYTDVMYAIATDKSKADNGGTVQLQFKHITSQVVFKAKKQLQNMVVEINSIKLHNFKHSGYFTIPTNGTAPQQSDWKYKTLPTQKPNTVIKDATINVGTEATDISKDKPMFLIPQKLTAWDTSNDITTADTKNESYLSIECKISIDGFYKLGSTTTYGTLYVPFPADWQPGKRYVYTLVFGGGYDADGNTILQPVNFKPEVQDWVEDATTGNNIPLYQ